MSELADLVAIVDHLRGPDGCPWDRSQTLSSIRPYLLEECYEVLDAIDAGRIDLLREELGDLLFMVVFLARMCQEAPEPFGLDEVARGIAHKMVERHPHVFAGDAEPDHEDPGSIDAWEARKSRDPKKQRRSRLDGVPRSLPALLRAHRQGEKAAATGFDWPDRHGVLDKVKEELAELEAAVERGDAAAVEHEYGDVLMAMATLGRHVGATPEEALRAANDRFANRFGHMEDMARARALDLSELDPDAQEALWQAAKRREGRARSR